MTEGPRDIPPGPDPHDAPEPQEADPGSAEHELDPEADTQPARRSPGVIVGIVVLVVVLAVATFWLWWGNRPDDSSGATSRSASSLTPATQTPTATPGTSPSGTSSAAGTPTTSSAPTSPARGSSPSSAAVVAPSAPAAGSASGSSPAPAGGDTVAASDLKVGDCFLNPGSANQVQGLTRVACSQPHYAEVYGAFQLGGSSYPGDSTVTSQSDDGCGTRFTTFIGRSVDGSELTYMYLSPTEQSWTRNADRVVTCAVYQKSDKNVTGSLKGANR